MEPLSRTESNLDTCRRGPPLIKLMGYEHRDDAVGDGGSMQCLTHTHKRTHSVPRDTQGGWNLGQGSEPILTHVSVALPLIKLMGSELWDAQWGAESAGTVKHTHTQCPRDTEDR